MTDAALGTLVIAAGVCLVAFLVLRSVLLWYWKVDRIVELLEQQSALLQKLCNMRDPANKTRCSACHGAIDPNAPKCQHCGEAFNSPPAPTSNNCSNCGTPWQSGVATCPNCGRIRLLKR